MDYIIPSNDDAIRAIKLIVEAMSNAALEGLALRKGSDDMALVTGTEEKMAAGEDALTQMRTPASPAAEAEAAMPRSFDPGTEEQN